MDMFAYDHAVVCLTKGCSLKRKHTAAKKKGEEKQQRTGQNQGLYRVSWGAELSRVEISRMRTGKISIPEFG